MDRAHRQELKHDKFVDQVGQGIEYASGHRTQVIRYAIVAAVVVAVAAGGWAWMKQQESVRQDALRVAVRSQEAQIGQPNTAFMIGFADQKTKEVAVQKAWQDLASKHGGSTEGVVAEYYLGVNAADQGNLPEAEKRLKLVADSGKSPYSSQAKLSLARVYSSLGKNGEAEKMLRSLMNEPTILVSKEEATLALGRLLATTNQAEARKLLEPLRSSRGPISRAAISTLSEIPAAR
ncbi:MAG: tetratricopeptide repeat protein [Bryobacteraceae bacterium]|nr:tetratricopeptide repeat protein [Bryobacteraceae bacterium]